MYIYIIVYIMYVYIIEKILIYSKFTSTTSAVELRVTHVFISFSFK